MKHIRTANDRLRPTRITRQIRRNEFQPLARLDTALADHVPDARTVGGVGIACDQIARLLQQRIARRFLVLEDMRAQGFDARNKGVLHSVFRPLAPALLPHKHGGALINPLGVFGFGHVPGPFKR